MPPLIGTTPLRSRPRDAGARNLALLVAGVLLMLLGYYAFLAWRARLWSPAWAVTETAGVTAGGAP